MKHVDADGKETYHDGDNHYAATKFIRGFQPFIKTVESRTQVRLHHVSVLDNSVILDEHTCAVTIGSTFSGTVDSPSSNFITKCIYGDVGHAMLVVEGLDERGGECYLRYIHATQQPKEKVRELNFYEGEIELFERTGKSPLNLLHGPTWSRSKDYVDDMLRFVQECKQRTILMLPYGGLFTSIFKPRFSVPVPILEHIPATLAGRYTCLHWVLHIVEMCRVSVPCTSYLITPIAKVRELNEKREFFLH